MSASAPTYKRLQRTIQCQRVNPPTHKSISYFLTPIDSTTINILRYINHRLNKEVRSLKLIWAPCAQLYSYNTFWPLLNSLGNKCM